MFDQSSPYFEIFLKGGQTIKLNGTVTKRLGSIGFLGYNFDTREGVEILKIDDDSIAAVVQHG